MVEIQAAKTARSSGLYSQPCRTIRISELSRGSDLLSHHCDCADRAFLGTDSAAGAGFF